MKFVVGLVLCFTFAALALTPQEIKENLKAAKTKCQSDPATAIDDAAMKTYIKSKGQGEKPANIGPHSLCMSKEIGWQNADGTINKEHLKERLSAEIRDATKIEEIMNECALQQEDDVATAGHLFKCVMKHARGAESH